MSLQVAIVPLDDRPVNTRALDDLGSACGVRVHRPPAEVVRGIDQATPAPGLDEWMREAAATSDALIVNINQLVFGGYVASRRFREPMEQSLERLEILRDIRARHPELPLRAFITLLRTRDADHSGGTEPDYWTEHGRAITRHSSAMYHEEHGQPTVSEPDVPRALLDDFYLRRLRLHALQLAAIEAVADGTLDELVIGVEDSRVDSVSTSEREWLTAWSRRLGLADRVRCYPGADEIAGAQLAGVIAQLRAQSVRVRIIVDDDAALDSVAAFEDVPVRMTLQEQCRTAKVTVVDAGEDVVLAVHAPVAPARDWNCGDVVPSSEESTALSLFADRIAAEVRGGACVVVADVAQSNGGDPALVAALERRGALAGLAGYSGWNTAGNTLGTAVAIACAAASSHGDDTELARLLAHRVVEDVSYQSVVRSAFLQRGMSAHDASESVHERLAAELASLPSLAKTWQLAGDSVRLPWNRLFEVDFRLEPRGQQ